MIKKRNYKRKHKRNNKRAARTALIAFVAVLVLSLTPALAREKTAQFSSSFSEDRDKAETETLQTKETVFVHLAGEPGDPVPFKVMDRDTASLLRLVCEGLVTLDENGNPVPGSAESWKVSKDGLRWEFTLRDDLCWADGSEMTASDFAALFHKLADPASEALYGSDLVDTIAGYEEILNGDPEALDVSARGDRTLVIHLSTPDPDFAKKCASWTLLPIREQIREDNGDYVTADWQTITGNGPYYIASVEPGREYVLKKNPYYHGNSQGNGNPENSESFEEVHWMTDGDANQEFSDFLNGDFDAMAEIPSDEIIDGEESALYQEKTIADTLGILFNCRSEALEDARVRRALEAAIDRSYLSSEILNDHYVPADMTTLTAFSSNDSSDSSPAKAEPADPALARKLLKEAGYEDGKGMPVLTCVTDENGSAPLVAQYLASVWQDLGIDVRVETESAGDLAQQKTAGTFDIICGNLFLPSDLPGAELARFVSENEENICGFSSEKYDRRMEKAEKETKDEKYADRLQDALEVLEKEMPVVALAERRVEWLRQDTVAGIFCDASGCWQLWKTPQSGQQTTKADAAGTSQLSQNEAENNSAAEQSGTADTEIGTVEITEPGSTMTAKGPQKVEYSRTGSAPESSDTWKNTENTDGGVLFTLKKHVQSFADSIADLRSSSSFYEKTDCTAYLTKQAWVLAKADTDAEKLISLPKYSEVHLVGTGNPVFAKIEQDGKFRYIDVDSVTADPAVLDTVRKEESESLLEKEMLTMSLYTAKETELSKRAANTHAENDRILEEIRHHEMIKTQTRNPNWDGPVLSRSKGSVHGPSGKETYYNLNMNGVVNIMRRMGNTDEYWVRDDGCKMLGDYIMCAANLGVHPRGSLVESSLGTCIVCDTGGFASHNSHQLDIAVTW